MFGMIFLVFFVIYESLYQEIKEEKELRNKKNNHDFLK